MKCHLALASPEDRPYWIRWDVFATIAHRPHLEFRDPVKPHFSQRWFRESGDRLLFVPAVFYLERGVAYFVNGRHRSTVISQCLPEVPMALASIEEDDEAVLARIARAPIAADEIIALPDLPTYAPTRRR